MAFQQYFTPDVLSFKDNRTFMELIDKLSRLKDNRRKKPLDQYDYIPYKHRVLYDIFNLQIGDTFFMIPPEFINITSQSSSFGVTTLRQENTHKEKSGYHTRNIIIDIVFNGLDQINGYKVEAPNININNDNFIYQNNGYYYVDGLRQLLAQFKCTPILPIYNELINCTYGIYTVALQSITISTVPGYPNVMIANVTLQEINVYPYIEMPDVYFQHMIDWDLFRFYYQTFLTEDKTYKRLQSLPDNKEHNKFKMSIIDSSLFEDNLISSVKQYNILEVICDKKIIKEGAKSNYITWIDSDVYDCVINDFQCRYSNMLTNVQLSDMSSPTIQFLGGMDTIYNINIETTDIRVIQAIEQCQLSNDLITRNNAMFRNCFGFVKLESELVEFTGSQFVMIDNVTTNTVPGVPGLYNVKIQCVSYDIKQSEREDLNGFLPFDCNDSRCNGKNSSLDMGNHCHSDQVIPNNKEGLGNKICQDNYAERKIRETIELYPDLHLPKYKEVDIVIDAISKFRSKNKLSPLPYNSYPRNPIGMLGGNKFPGISAEYSDKDKCIILPKDIDKTSMEYDGYVDPDFYVFYPNDYIGLSNDDSSFCNERQPKQRQGVTKTKTTTTYYDDSSSDYSDYSNGQLDNSLVEAFIAKARSYLGCKYIFGNAGQYVNGQRTFDCSGLIFFCLQEMGIISKNRGRCTVESMSNGSTFDDIFVRIPRDEMQRGDLITMFGDTYGSQYNHVVIYLGNNEIIEASGSKGAVVTNVQYLKKEHAHSCKFEDGTSGKFALRVRAFISESSNSGPIISDGNQNTYTNATENAHQDLGKWSMPDVNEFNKYIDSWLAKGGNLDSPFRGQAQAFINAGIKSGLDPRYIFAHACVESAYGKSKIAREKHNYFGITAYNNNPYGDATSFNGNSLEQSITEGAMWIKKNFYNRGQKTLYDMIYKDPNHRYAVYDNGKPNDQWVTQISQIMVGAPKGNNTSSSSSNNTNSSIDINSPNKLYGTSSRDSEGNSILIWNELKKYGLSDAACAGILGNMKTESGFCPTAVQGDYTKENPGQYDAEYTAKVDNGEISRYDFINNGPNGNGYGLVQFTWKDYKAQLYDKAKTEGKSIGDLSLQVEVFISQIKQSGVFNKLNSSSSPEDAAKIMMLQYERPANQSMSAQNVRASQAREYYNKYSKTSGTFTTYSEHTLTYDEYLSICNAVANTTVGTSQDSQCAMVELIYDRLTDPEKKYGTLANILSEFDCNDKHQTVSSILAIVRDVFENVNHPIFPNNCIYYYVDTESPCTTYNEYKTLYENLGYIDNLLYFGSKDKPQKIKYTILSTSGTGDASNSQKTYTETTEVTYGTDTIENAVNFGEPIITRCEKMRMRNSVKIWSEEVHKTVNIFNSSFCDEYQYSRRATLLRAFPTYLFCILDDNAQWFDGKKLWTNYYTHKSVIEIASHATNDMATETVTVTINNSYHNLDKVQSGLDNYSIENDPEYSDFIKWFYKNTHCLLGTGPKLTQMLIQLHQVICLRAKLREDTRVHIKIGYGSDPLSLATLINGQVSDVSIGNQISLVVTSDGNELIQHVTGLKETSSNNGFLGLFGLGAKQESSNIIADIMCKRSSRMTYLSSEWGEASKYSIEHFGLYDHQFQLLKLGTGIGGATGAIAGGALFNLPGALIGGLLGSAVGSAVSSGNIEFSDIWDEWSEQYDILKNIYKACYKPYLYHHDSIIPGMDGEKNIVFCDYNMTPWDVFQVCTQQAPEYIMAPHYHQFDSRLYFGLPFFMEKYRYDIINKEYHEESKSAAQVHFVDSMINIIDNQIRVTSKYSYTNCKVMYTLGKSATSTLVIHSDNTIDSSKQKTKILDTCITQDFLGPDALWQLGYKPGRQAARRLGISDLLYGWESQYQGSIICMGMPGVKPHDYIMLNDMYSNMCGLCSVREVIHSFSSMTGFTTSIVPGLIGFTTDENSGMIEMQKNYLGLLSGFMNLTEQKRRMRNVSESNMTLISKIYYERFNISCEYQNYAVLNGIKNAVGVTGIAMVGYDAFKLIRTLHNAEKAASALKHFAEVGTALKTFLSGFKTIKNVKTAVGAAKGIKNVFTAIKTGSLAFAGETFGASLIITAAVILLECILDTIFEYLSNKNVCVLLPLWWEAYPFVAGVKDGEHILLIPSDATATEENTRAYTTGDLYYENNYSDIEDN